MFLLIANHVDTLWGNTSVFIALSIQVTPVPKTKPKAGFLSLITGECRAGFV